MKKNTYIFALLMGIVLQFFACSPAPKDTAEATPAATADSAAVADVIHGFYKWYNTFVSDETMQIDFTNEEGEHLKLDQPALEKYYSHFKNAGFVNDAFIQNEYEFFKKCEKLWQNERIDEVPSCMDSNKHFCAQDWEIDYWVTSPVRIKSLGDNKVAATMYGTEAGTPKESNFELEKENGKWLISKIECDMGIE